LFNVNHYFIPDRELSDLDNLVAEKTTMTDGTIFAPVGLSGAGRKFRLPITAGLVLLIMAVTLPLVVFFQISIDKAQKNVMDRLIKESSVVISDLETKIHDQLDSVAVQSQRLAQLLVKKVDTPDTLYEPKKFERLISGALSGLPQVREIDLIDPRGMVYRLNQNSERLKVSNWSDVPAVQQLLSKAKEGLEQNWGNFFFAESTNRTLLNFYQPLAIRGRFAGLLVSVVSYQTLSDAIIKPNNSRLRNAFILYKRRYVLAHHNFSSINVALSDSQPLPTVGQIMDPVLDDYFGKDQPGPELVGDALYNVVDVSGVQYFVVYKNIAGYDKDPWIAGTYFPLSVVDAELDQIQQFRLLGLTILFLGLVAAYFVGRRVTKPIRHLASAARAIHRQGFSSVNGKNIEGSVFRELDDAAYAFNRMRSGLGHLSTYVPEGVTEHVLGKDGRSLVAEQHDVTVMFTDIVGFTTISAKLPAAEVAELLNIHFSLLADCVRAEGGTIDKYIGDSMMAFWLAQEDQCDHAEKAFSAALEMASRLRMFNKERREKGLEPIRLRIGLHTGPVIVGNIGAPGRYNYTLIGDTVNVAERVEKLSKEHIREDQDAIVFVTKDTLQCIGQETKEFSIGSHLLRGRGEPIEIFCFT